MLVMWLVIALGLVMIFTEFFIPSLGLLTVGAVAMFSLALRHAFGISETTGWIHVGLIGVLLIIDLVVAYRVYLRSPLVLNETGSSPAMGLGSELIGQTGSARTPLRPAGKVTIDGRAHHARAAAGFIEQGARIVVVGARAGELEVLRENA